MSALQQLTERIAISEPTDPLPVCVCLSRYFTLDPLPPAGGVPARE